MSAEPVPQLYTFEEFCEVIPDGQKADLLDGIIHGASPDSLDHNFIANFIQFLLDGYATRRCSGNVVASRVAFRLGLRSGPESDVAFVAREHQQRIEATRVIGGPDIAVEVVSRESRQRDYVRKRVLYEEAGVPEYWLIDPDRGETLFLKLVEGQYEQVEMGDEAIFRSAALPGFWLDVRWLFQKPLPDKLDCLEKILAGEPDGL